MALNRYKNKDAVMVAYGVITPKLSADDYADLVDKFDVSPFRTKTFYLVAATYDVVVNVLGSIDGGVTYDQIVEADIDVTTSAEVTKSYTAPYTHLKLQVKSKVSETAGTLSGRVFFTWL